jgi:YebC/PmpR family DNA-binding regulatory protein
MAGHNKWSKIKHKKGRNDAARGKLFSRLIKEVTVAARLGGGDPSGNPRLRAAITTARDSNMTKDTVERAIKKGTGELEGASYEEVLYEGYGPAGVAILVDAITDNKTRTVADVRHQFSKFGGSLAEPNAVAWQFRKCGQILIDSVGHDEDDLMMIVLEAGAEDLSRDDNDFVVECNPEDLFLVHQALEQQSVVVREAKLTFVATNTTDIPAKKVASVLRLLDALDDCDDVQNLHVNAVFPDVPE